MSLIEKNKAFSIEEYFDFEERSETRHEMFYGNLIEMSGSTVFHNEITGNLYMLFRTLLKNSDWKVFIENVKVRVGENTFFYPDILISKPVENKYFSKTPVLITEVMSDSTRKFDLSDKFIQYQKIETLHYYLCVEPEQQVVIFNFKNEQGEWMTETYTKHEQIIVLNKLNIQLTLKDIYHS